MTVEDAGIDTWCTNARSALAVPNSSATVSVRIPKQASPCIKWGATQLESALARVRYQKSSAGRTVEVVIDTSGKKIGHKGQKSEGYRLTIGGGRARIIGNDEPGAMYGCLELAKRIKDTGRLPEQLDVSDGPSMSLRATCILLEKLGLYDYPVTPKEFPWFYDKAMWKDYLDFLVENRFNAIAFWNGHPFDYFIKMDKYPEAQKGMEPGLVQKNHDMLMWLGREAQKRNIWLMFQFYNIHTSVFSEMHTGFHHGTRSRPHFLRNTQLTASNGLSVSFRVLDCMFAWVRRLTEKYGSRNAAEHILNSYEALGDVLPGLERVIMLGVGGHTVLSAGVMLDQIPKECDIHPEYRLPLPGVVRIPDYVNSLKKGETVAGTTPLDYISGRLDDAETGLREARLGAAAAISNRADANALATDARAQVLLVIFFRDKLRAGIAKDLLDAGIRPQQNTEMCLNYLKTSLKTFRKLTQLTNVTYDSITDCPAWKPVNWPEAKPGQPCPFHWSDLLPVYEKEYVDIKNKLTNKTAG